GHVRAVPARRLPGQACEQRTSAPRAGVAAAVRFRGRFAAHPRLVSEPMTDARFGAAPRADAVGGPLPRRIAVVPAYNEQPTVAAVLDQLYHHVDELVVVDDGSTDGTRRAIETWLPGHDRAQLLVHDVNQGMSEAYFLALSALRERLQRGELSPN